MEALLAPLKELKEFNEIKERIEKNQTPIHITGCIDSQKCHLIYGLSREKKFRVIITYNDLKAKDLYEDYKLYDKNVFLYPAKDAIFYSADVRGNAIISDRITILKRILEEKPTTIITTIDGGMDKVLPLEFLKEHVILLERDRTVELEQLKKELVALGYERVGQVEGAGQFAIRGGIIDIFPLTEDCPYRIELWDDEIDTIRSFDVESQRSIEYVEKLEIYPATEIVLENSVMAAGVHKLELEKKEYVSSLKAQKKFEEAKRMETIIEEFQENLDIYGGSMGMESYISYFYDHTISFFDYFSKKDTVFFLDEPNRIEEKGEAIEVEFRESMQHRLEKGYVLPGQVDVIYPYKKIMAGLGNDCLVLMSMMDYKISEFSIYQKGDFMVRSTNTYNGNFEVLVKDLVSWQEKDYRMVVFTSSKSRAKRLSEDLRNEYQINAFFSEDEERTLHPGELMVVHGNLHRGYEYPLIRFVVISESDIFGAEQKKRKKKKNNYDGKKIQNFNDLSVGDYVIHENHGVGIYQGIEKIKVDKTAKDYIKIQYGDGGILYVLATGLDVLQKFANVDTGRKPKLNKLGGQEWKKTKTKVRKAVHEVAKELVELYAKRQSREGYQFGEDTVWQREFEEMFPYEETEDQLKAIEDTKSDMESKKIMDRLVCGDVGYGKTEIAIRAAFKAVNDGKQVAFLVPTTILAQQHYNTFIQRMMDFPVRIGMLSRFRTTAQNRKTIEDLKRGAVDIVIGTHRLLSKDVGFKNLGLLIVDEEQRFGVTHKEKIKQMKGDVDVLTLSATPIPRTLHMSLIGIRDMSVLEEAPVDRLPIQTYVLEYNEEMIREAISRELARDGQVYYVYNRVNGIEDIAAAIRKLVPEANIAFAHGQMSPRELEKIMMDFINGEIDVLVSTTIVETGLDISNVNTMIIHDADKLGLSQLYQLRGRVGRSNRTAYAFLMYKRDKMLREVAEKRLQAMREFTELGSGIKIAMKDLEIRGAGNLLGERQHGHMESVGYDLYCKMLNDAVRKLKGEEVDEIEIDTVVDMDFDAFIPATYIRSEFQKLEMYKRIAEIESKEEYMDMQDELIDRFGELPKAVENLLYIAYLKSLAKKVYIIKIMHRGARVRMLLHAEAKIHVENIPEVVKRYSEKLRFESGKEKAFVYEWKRKKATEKINAREMFQELEEVLHVMEEVLIGCS